MDLAGEILSKELKEFEKHFKEAVKAGYRFWTESCTI